MKIFDCFKFFNELEILELRFMELYDTVDYFVLVEANKTHTGKEKSYIFEDNKEMFKPYLDKVIHVKVDDLPGYSVDDIWKAENYQRNCIMRGLVDIAEPGDKIIVSDLDEIPNTDVIKENLNDPNWVTFNQKLYYYYVNCQQNCDWNGPIMANYGTFSSPQQLRNAGRAGMNRKRNGGWHYSFMGGPERVRTKVENIAESHYIIDDVGDVDEIKNKMESQVDLWNRTEDYAKKEIVDISDNRPKAMDKFLEKYPHFFFNKTTVTDE
jgi:beta-1,4-mannosyl-glycoprotein beta-1,4-N-acetylglucosaminyltransferase